MLLRQAFLRTLGQRRVEKENLVLAQMARRHHRRGGAVELLVGGKRLFVIERQADAGVGPQLQLVQRHRLIQTDHQIARQTHGAKRRTGALHQQREVARPGLRQQRMIVDGAADLLDQRQHQGIALLVAQDAVGFLQRFDADHHQPEPFAVAADMLVEQRQKERAIGQIGNGIMGGQPTHLVMHRLQHLLVAVIAADQHADLIVAMAGGQRQLVGQDRLRRQLL